MDLSLGRYLAHPADPRTPQVPEYATEQAVDHALSIPAHWASFVAEYVTKYDCGDIKAWSIKPEDIRDCDAGQLLVLAITGTNEQATVARLYLQEAFCEHHAELIGQLESNVGSDNDGPDEWEAA
jgi:hypothetical protein